MRPLKNEVKKYFADKFDCPVDKLIFLAGGSESSDGILFWFMDGNTKSVLKISASEDEESAVRLTKKLEFAKYLSEYDVSVAFPRVNKFGNIIELYKDGDVMFMASVMNFIDGKELDVKLLTPEVIEKWGSLTGRMHSASKKYGFWKNLGGDNFDFEYKSEIAMFEQWCKNDEVKKHWNNVKKDMTKMRIDRDTYGMTHNDNHQKNVMLSGNNLYLIDFDCAACHFFANDIFLPIQGLLFDVAGGFNRPLQDVDSVKRFYNWFLKGYEKENHFEEEWLSEMTYLLNYRRCLLFTVMQGWMENDANARNSFINMMNNPCELLIV